MDTRDVRNVCSAILLGCALFCIAGCPKHVKDTTETIKTMATSPRMVSVERTVYDIGPAEWSSNNFSIGLYQDRPIAAFRSPVGLSLAIAIKPLPQSSSDWQVVLIDGQPKIRFIRLAVAEKGAFICYSTGSKVSQRWMLASCTEAEPADPHAWSLKELPEDLGKISVRSITTDGELLGIACRNLDSRLPMYISRGIGKGNAGWSAAIPDGSLSGVRNLTLLSLEGNPLLGYASADKSGLGLLVGSTSGMNDWRSTCIANAPAGELPTGDVDFAAKGKTAGVVFHQGEPRVLRIAITADAAASSPVWNVSDIVSWDMLGLPDLKFNGDLPVVAYTADFTGLFAFFAETSSPTGYRDWLMCQLCDDLGENRYNGVEALIIDGHLLAVYIKEIAAGKVSLGATVIEIPK